MKGEKALVSDISTAVNHHNQIVLSIEKDFQATMWKLIQLLQSSDTSNEILYDFELNNS